MRILKLVFDILLYLLMIIEVLIVTTDFSHVGDICKVLCVLLLGTGLLYRRF